mmetsp:Transcript_9776/g.38059  ORF Transcript_9776/g.38059 Transcript_9776/m.38059 type:complete len:231 (+) Transcript_9776:460-1152(+)
MTQKTCEQPCVDSESFWQSGLRDTVPATNSSVSNAAAAYTLERSPAAWKASSWSAASPDSGRGWNTKSLPRRMHAISYAALPSAGATTSVAPSLGVTSSDAGRADRDIRGGYVTAVTGALALPAVSPSTSDWSSTSSASDPALARPIGRARCAEALPRLAAAPPPLAPASLGRLVRVLRVLTVSGVIAPSLTALVALNTSSSASRLYSMCSPRQKSRGAQRRRPLRRTPA